MTSNDLFSLLNTELTLPAATSAAAAVFPGPQECHPYPAENWGWRKKEWRKERKGTILVFSGKQLIRIGRAKNWSISFKFKSITYYK
jgi:hypothetical protein